MDKLNIDHLATAAHAGLDAFTEAGGTYFGDNTDEKLQDFLAGLHHLADRYGFSWERILERGEGIYQTDKKDQLKKGD